ncbi:MAG: methyltransferase [Asgard group archaeon]|nr:methyltransferase [Asgard group archaeon]
MRIKRKNLEIFLEQVEEIQQPKLQFEQYFTPPRVAANLLWMAGIENNDIFDKIVLDMGCGSGILALGAAYLGAREVIGLDIDYDSLLVAKKNSTELDFTNNCYWLCAKAEDCFLKGIDTIIMNPPFGMRKESLSRDRFFLEKALELSNNVYSINPHADKTRTFFIDYCKDLGAEIKQIIQMDFEIKKLYQFHKLAQHVTTVDLYIIKKEK